MIRFSKPNLGMEMRRIENRTDIRRYIETSGGDLGSLFPFMTNTGPSFYVVGRP